MVNAHMIEIEQFELRQRHLHRELGYDRLFREVGTKGPKCDKMVDSKIHKAFVTWSTKIKDRGVKDRGILRINN